MDWWIGYLLAQLITNVGLMLTIVRNMVEREMVLKGRVEGKRGKIKVGGKKGGGRHKQRGMGARVDVGER